MNLVLFQHHVDEPPGRMADILNQHGHHVRIVHPYAGEAVPRELAGVDGVVSMGGPQNVDQAAMYPWLNDEMALLKLAHERGKPIAGVCLGAQLLAAALGGKVAAMPHAEIGWEPVRLNIAGQSDPIFQGIAWDSIQFHFHAQEVTQLPPAPGTAPGTAPGSGAAPGAIALASSKNCKVQAYKVGLTSYGFQFHFEWDQEHLLFEARDAQSCAPAGTSEAIVAQIPQFYDDYRRRGDLLCKTLATQLFLR